MIRNVGHARDDMISHPVRNMLAIFSVFIGVLSVVAIITVAGVTKEVFLAASEQRYGRLTTMHTQLDGPLPVVEQIVRSVKAARIAAPGAAVVITATTSESTGFSPTTNGPHYAPFIFVDTTFVAGDLTQVKRLPILHGRWISQEHTIPVEIVINEAAQGLLGVVGGTPVLSFGSGSPPVATLTVGVVADGESTPKIYVSLPAVLTIREQISPSLSASLVVHHPTETRTMFEELTTRTVGLLGMTHDPQGLNRLDQVDDLLLQLKSQQQGFLIAAVVALFVSALGILNIGLSSVRERSHEFVVRRALGARRSDLTWQVLLHSLGIGVIASALAVTTVIVGVRLWVPNLIAQNSAIVPPGVPWEAVLWGLVAASATTLLGALAPAIVASRLNMADALRA